MGYSVLKKAPGGCKLLIAGFFRAQCFIFEFGRFFQIKGQAGLRNGPGMCK